MSRALGDYTYKAPENQVPNPTGFLERAVKSKATVLGDFITAYAFTL